MNLFRFTCGHVGRTNASPRTKVQAFIRVAEIRNARVEPVPKKCPHCEQKD